jgi:SAM-dependent methyltransferase
MDYSHIDQERIATHSEYKDYPVHFNRLLWIYDRIDKHPAQPTEVLDIGCGTGNITIPLALARNANITGLDFNLPNIEVCKSRNTFENAQFHHGDLNTYDLKKFDFLIFTEVLEHIPNYDPTLKYLADNMKDDAQVLITIPNGWGPFEICMWPLYFLRKIGLNGFIRKIKDLLGKKEPYATNQEEDPHVNFFTIPSFRRAMKRNGLRVVAIEKAYVFSPIIETYLPFVSLKTIAKWDNRLARILPRFLASGWFFAVEKEKK